MIPAIRVGDVVTMVDLRTGERTTVVVESYDATHAIVRPAHDPDEGRWRVGLGFLFPLDRNRRAH